MNGLQTIIVTIVVVVILALLVWGMCGLGK